MFYSTNNVYLDFNTPKYLVLIKVLWLLSAAFLVLSGMSSCSQESHSFANRTFHNTTARYNAYFLARERMKEVDQTIWKANVDDYNKVLKIFPVLDQNLQASIAPNLEEIIKKAALPVTKHKNSNWVDDSYLLIGKSRLYQADYPLAMETFKYVNSKGADINARHQALIYLMRTFIVTKDFENSNTVFNYLKKEKLNPDNSAEFYITRAFHFAAQDDVKSAEAYLTLASSNISLKEFKARVHFIIAQIHQLNGNIKEAHFNYSETLKNNPPYELSFYAKLYRTQVEEMKDKGDNKKIQSYFKKLLKDKKNIEYKDKIYYEMGLFELKQNNIPQAISFLHKSLLEKSKNTFQKGATYLRLGRVYYENLQNYEMAKAYYDSTVAVWDTKDKDYKPIAQRQRVLEEFVKHLKIVNTQDSLQKLAAMDTALLKTTLLKFIAANEQKQKEEEKRLAAATERAERIKQNQEANTLAGMDMTVDINSAQKWYFYNPTQMASGRTEFGKKWGKRPLEDNWRRSVKENSGIADNTANDLDTTQVKVIERSPEEIRNEALQVMLKDIPATPGQMKVSNQKLENSLYNLGKIYNQKLNEPSNAVSSFERYLTKFSDSDNAPEVLYFLYLIYNQQQNSVLADQVKAKIFELYPNFIYAKIIKNPNYLSDTEIANKKAEEGYKSAFNLYKSSQYLAADSLVNSIRFAYPDNNIEDKLSLLQILVLGKTKNEVVYKAALENFIKSFNTSLLVPKAKEYLAAAEGYISNKVKKGGMLDSAAVRYSDNLDQKHLFAMVVPSTVNKEKTFTLFKNFHKQTNKYANLQVVTIVLNDTTSLVTVDSFEDKNEAKRYAIEAKNHKEFITLNPDLSTATFVISKSNMAVLARSKYLKDYLNFYIQKYQ